MPAICADKPPYHLSGGEKKRVAIATVLSMEPNILVLDEPTSGLDPFARRQLMQLMREFHHTKIFTSHDLDMVMELCDRVIVLGRGRVRADGAPAEIFADGNRWQSAGWKAVYSSGLSDLRRESKVGALVLPNRNCRLSASKYKKPR